MIVFYQNPFHTIYGMAPCEFAALIANHILGAINMKVHIYVYSNVENIHPYQWISDFLYIICHNACTRQAYYSENTDVTEILSFYRGTMECFFIYNALIKYAQIHVKTPGMHPNVMRTYFEAMHGGLTGFLR